MGPGDDATQRDIKTAYELGRALAKHQWVVLNGGRNVGVMDAVSRGVKSVGGLSIGILPTSDDVTASKALDIVIPTGMGDARNNINVLSSDVIVVCGMNPGTASEVAFGLKLKKTIILLNALATSISFFQSLDKKNIRVAHTVNQAIQYIQNELRK